MTTATTVEGFLSGGGAPAVKFPEIGAKVVGIVEDAAVSQQVDFATGQLKTYDDGNPMMQLVVTLQTEERDPDIADDDGKRRLFVRGQMTKAVKEAVKASGATTIEPGGKLAVQYKEDGEPPRPNFNAPKLFVAQYKAGEKAAVAVDELL